MGRTGGGKVEGYHRCNLKTRRKAANAWRTASCAKAWARCVFKFQFRDPTDISISHDQLLCSLTETRHGWREYDGLVRSTQNDAYLLVQTIWKSRHGAPHYWIRWQGTGSTEKYPQAARTCGNILTREGWVERGARRIGKDEAGLS